MLKVRRTLHSWTSNGMDSNKDKKPPLWFLFTKSWSCYFHFHGGRTSPFSYNDVLAGI